MAYARKISLRGAAAPIRVSIITEHYQGGAGDGERSDEEIPFSSSIIIGDAVAAESLIGSCFLSLDTPVIRATRDGKRG